MLPITLLPTGVRNLPRGGMYLTILLHKRNLFTNNSLATTKPTSDLLRWSTHFKRTHQTFAPTLPNYKSSSVTPSPSLKSSTAAGNADQERETEWITSYSDVTIAQAEQRLGFRIRSLKGIPVDRMLGNANDGEIAGALLTTKEKVYDQIVQYLQIEGYPTEAEPSFEELKINHLVYAIISPILSDFICKTGRDTVQLRSEKEIVSTDGEIGGTEEFAVLDLISVKDEKFILIVEIKRSSLEQAMKQCLLAMKDMRDNNGGVGKVYGFITTGETWQMLSYDGTLQMTNKIDVLFYTMAEEKEKWMKGYSDLVDCMYVALNNGAK